MQAEQQAHPSAGPDAQQSIGETSQPRLPPMHFDRPSPMPPTGSFWTWYYRAVFRRRGIRYGKGLRVMGPLLLRLDGDPGRVRIGDGVTLMPWVDLKNRENGQIVLHDGVQLDTMARLVAANNATIELGQEVKLGAWNIINAGADISIGRGTITAANVYLNASDHQSEPGVRIVEQGYWHAPVIIGDDCWIGAYTSIAPGTLIGAASIVGAHSRVRGTIEPRQVVAGNPLKVLRSR